MRPFQNSPAEWPIVITVAVCVAVVCLYLSGCKLHENPIGHRIDQAPVIVVTPSKPDDDGGAR